MRGTTPVVRWHDCRERDRAFGVEKDRRLVGLLDEGVAVARRVSRLAEPANQCGAEQVRRVIFDSLTSNRVIIHGLTRFTFSSC